MDRTAAQEQLEQLYSAWKNTLEPSEQAVALSPPLLLTISEVYAASKMKVLIIGQETRGWSWSRDLKLEYPSYPEDWPFSDICGWNDFVRDSDGVKALCWAYSQFESAKHQPDNRQSPLWRAFREVSQWPDCGVMTTNVCRADFQGGSAIKEAPADVINYLEQAENGLLASEIQILAPDVCLFFTGWEYDDALSARFPGQKMSAVQDYPVRHLARVHHEKMPPRSFRTYHPSYLQRSSQWGLIAELRNQVF